MNLNQQLVQFLCYVLFSKMSHLFLIFLLIVLELGISHEKIQNSIKNAYNFGAYVKDAFPQCSPFDYCLTTDQFRPHMTQFSTKNAYRTKTVFNDDDFTIENCDASKIWLLIRHGTRLPTSKGIRRLSKMEKLRDEIVANAARLKTNPFCDADWNALKNWKWNHSITETQANYLVAQGYLELQSIASNYKKYFPNLFDKAYDPNFFHFRHTNTERSRSSFNAFVNELFKENANQILNAVSPQNQPNLFLKAYANCLFWQEQKKQLKQSTSETHKFENSNIFRKLIDDMSNRLGIKLDANDVKNIFHICRYEQAWHVNTPSIWCSLLTASQVHILEYQEDLNYYYKSSHGSRLNKNIQCFAMQDMLNRLENNAAPKTTVYFSHSAAIQLFLTSLGALKDDIALKANNFAQTFNRKWQTSVISPFATSIAIVRYKCPNNDLVKFFLNEETLYFDWCSSKGTCDWLDVKKIYKSFAHANCKKFFCEAGDT